MAAPRVAFISGHTDLSDTDFEQHYIPQIEVALEARDSFIFGDATGVDTQAIDFLLSPSTVAKYPSISDRITLYTSRVNNISRLEKLVTKVISPKDNRLQQIPEELESLMDGVKDKGRDRARYKHMLRDTHLTLDSDYDILWVRSEEKSREFYGSKYRPRISATEINRQRRENLKAKREGREIVYARGKKVHSDEIYEPTTSEENKDCFDELPEI